MIQRTLLFGIVLLLTIPAGLRAQDTEFNTLLFQTTFKIEGPGASPGSLSLGTVFLMAKPITNTTRFRSVMITARHVLDNIHGHCDVEPEKAYRIWMATRAGCHQDPRRGTAAVDRARRRRRGGHVSESTAGYTDSNHLNESSRR